jgi:quercetin dioxygenase-like cupin family protein
MPPNPLPDVRAAEVVLPCAELPTTLSFFVDRLGFRVDAVHPADDPSVAVISGHGVRIRLERGAGGAPGRLRLLCRDPLAGGATELTAPNGTRIEIVPADPPLVLPPLQPSFVLSRASDAAAPMEGRAGMRYRDLIPGRQGGRFIASHIHIPEAGPVPDYVHFHRVRFQMIYCARGWVRVVYEDQGPAFVLREGDCVLQPPRIRHRVLESSAGLEVVEISSPANHETVADHDLTLPTPTVAPDRDFGGQHFVRHEAATATWQPCQGQGFEVRDLGIAAATKGLAGARVLRTRGARSGSAGVHDAELLFGFVLGGMATLDRDAGQAEPLATADAFVIPAGMRYAVRDCTDGFELLEVALPAMDTDAIHSV